MKMLSLNHIWRYQMNIKHVSLFTVMLIIGFTNTQAANRKVNNLEEIRMLYRASKIDFREYAVPGAKKHPLFSELEASRQQCAKTRSCHVCPEYQRMITLWHETPEGKNLAYTQMREVALWKMKNYLSIPHTGQDDIDRVTTAIHSALYVDIQVSTPTEKSIREQVAKELCSAIKSNVIEQELERKKR